jgi:hypothetical protein
MSYGLPFAALQASATLGKTVKVTANATPTSVPGSLALTAILQANNIRVYNAGTVLIYARLSVETTPSATAADIPVAAGAAVIVQNPVQQGTVGLAVLSSTTTACDVYFTPGEGGT